MPKMTVLEIVNSVLSDMDSDEVNSINDTIEAQQVVDIAKTTYFWLMSKRDWPHLNSLDTLENVSDTSRPTYLKLPVEMYEVVWFSYNKREDGDTRDDYKELTYLKPDVFLARQNTLNETNSNITQITDYSGVKFNIYTDRAPSFWTSFDDEYIICDSYDSARLSTLIGADTQVYGTKEPTWSSLDTSIPDLPSEVFPTYLEEVKSAAFLALKEVANEKAESRAQRGQRRLSRKSWRAKGGISLPDYGRGGSKGYRGSPYFDKT